MTQSTPTSERTHPVHKFAGAVLDAFARLGDPATWSMTGDELAETITDLHHRLARLTPCTLARGAGRRGRPGC